MRLSSLFHSNFGKKGRRNAARVWRALKGWKRKSPPRPRKPWTWPEIAAIANRLVQRGEFMKAVWVLLCFGGYLRPSDALRLRRQDFVAPVAGVSGINTDTAFCLSAEMTIRQKSVSGSGGRFRIRSAVVAVVAGM